MNSALYNLEGDFGFSPANASAPAPEVGHEVKLINFDRARSRDKARPWDIPKVVGYSQA